MTVQQLIYSSQPFGYDSATLGGILVVARRNNRRAGLTGALICRHDIYLQLLEGPADAVAATFARIVRDDRHLDVVGHRSIAVEARLFPAWDMLDDPARSWLWTPAEIAGGAVAAAGGDAVTAVFQRVADELRPKGDTASTGDGGAAACPRASIA